MAAGARAQGDARLLRAAVSLTGIGSPGLDRAIDAVDDAGRGLMRGGAALLESETRGQLLDILG
ncbi:MAG: hypothetical protein AB8G96_12310 [Phycisphaerales bacterium]